MKISIKLYKSKVLASGAHPLMVCISHMKERKYVSTGLFCQAKYWDFNKNEPKRNHPDRNLLETVLAQKLAIYHTKVLGLESGNKEVSVKQVLQVIGLPKQQQDTRGLFLFLSDVIQGLMDRGKVGRARLYKRLLSSLKEFNGNKELAFSDVDVPFLNRYEVFLYQSRLVENSINTYLKVLRALLNMAIKDKMMKKESYPFNDYSLSKFSTLTKKRAITKEELKRVADLDFSKNKNLSIARDLFLFSYYGQGMNFRDMAYLKWSQVVNGSVIYTRMKTGKVIHYDLLPPAIDILGRYKLSDSQLNGYIFNILDDTKHTNPVQIDNRVKHVLKKINSYLEEISKMAGIAVHLTMYVARHTYATVLKESGIPTSVISEALGHKSEFITQTYLKSFSNDVIKQANYALLLSGAINEVKILEGTIPVEVKEVRV